MIVTLAIEKEGGGGEEVAERKVLLFPIYSTYYSVKVFIRPQGVLFTFINTNNSNSDVSKTRSSSSSSPFHEKESEDDEIQRRSTGKSSLGWTAWSDFSTCSRTCDGGVATQLRRCNNPQGCKGESVRYKICNMQACPDHRDFRAQQCTAFDEVPYDGALFKWSPHYDYAEPCALTCR